MLYDILDDTEMKERVIFVASQSGGREAVDFLMDVARNEEDKELKERAMKEGFDVVGVAAADRLERDEVTLTQWLAAGRHADRKWMAHEPEKRADPPRVLRGGGGGAGRAGCAGAAFGAGSACGI